MKNVFLICGYGVPKNILVDGNYNTYLRVIFNKIYDLGLKNPLIIASGGKTDIIKPYRRTEAEEIIKLLKSIGQRPFLKKIIKDWKFIPEKKSLSTLENLLFTQSILQKKRVVKAKLYIFCENTRADRIKILAKKVFNKNYNLQIIPIDFDISLNRYLDRKFLDKKESGELKHSLWALKSPFNLKKHHDLFEEKIAYFRKIGSKNHPEVIKKWWEKKISNIAI